MSVSLDLMAALAVLAITVYGFAAARGKALSLSSGDRRVLHSLPNYYGYHAAWMIALPAVLVLIVWLQAEGAVLRALVLGALPADIQAQSPEALATLWRDIVAQAETGTSVRQNQAITDGAAHLTTLKTVSGWLLLGVSVLTAFGLARFAIGQVRAEFRARNAVERRVHWLLIACSAIAIVTTVGIVASLLFESLRFFARVPVTDFLFGLQWSPQTALRAEQVGSSGAFGAVPLFIGTMLIMLIAMAVAAPIGLLSAIYLSDYAGKRTRALVKPAIEILAGVPTVVYGFFAFLTVGPFLRDLLGGLGYDTTAQLALSAGMVMGLMIIPFVSSLSDDVINAVPQSLRDGSYALGATRSETMMRVIFPAALPGIAAALLLGVSRAIGETMIVVMAAGVAANLTVNPLERVTTVTVQIVALLTGDQAFDTAKTLSAFALGLVLFAVTLTLNIIALRIVQAYREKYD